MSEAGKPLQSLWLRAASCGDGDEVVAVQFAECGDASARTDLYSMSTGFSHEAIDDGV